MGLRKPRRLEMGDCLGVVAPASPPAKPAMIDGCVAGLRALGFKVKLGKAVRRRHGYLAGTDLERAADIERMFTDPKINGIVCLRGGYGSARLLSRLDYPLLRQHAKVFLGASDITSLHAALLRSAQMVVFHGPMGVADFTDGSTVPYTLERCFQTLLKTDPPGSILQGYPEPSTVEVLRPGSAEGRLTGGNLTILCTLIGTPWQPIFKNRILCLEDINEAPYRVDRHLTYLLNTGLLAEVKGVAIGLCKSSPKAGGREEAKYRALLREIFRERLSPLAVPVVTGLPFGHVRHTATLPLGIRARLDADRGDLTIEEPAVR